MDIADYFAMKQELWAQYAGPGHWNDPDTVCHCILYILIYYHIQLL